MQTSIKTARLRSRKDAEFATTTCSDCGNGSPFKVSLDFFQIERFFAILRYSCVFKLLQFSDTRMEQTALKKTY